MASAEDIRGEERQTQRALWNDLKDAVESETYRATWVFRDDTDIHDNILDHPNPDAQYRVRVANLWAGHWEGLGFPITLSPPSTYFLLLGGGPTDESSTDSPSKFGIFFLTDQDLTYIREGIARPTATSYIEGCIMTQEEVNQVVRGLDLVWHKVLSSNPPHIPIALEIEDTPKLRFGHGADNPAFLTRMWALYPKAVDETYHARQTELSAYQSMSVAELQAAEAAGTKLVETAKKTVNESRSELQKSGDARDALTDIKNNELSIHKAYAEGRPTAPAVLRARATIQELMDDFKSIAQLYTAQADLITVTRKLDIIRVILVSKGAKPTGSRVKLSLKKPKPAEGNQFEISDQQKLLMFGHFIFAWNIGIIIRGLRNTDPPTDVPTKVEDFAELLTQIEDWKLDEAKIQSCKDCFSYVTQSPTQAAGATAKIIDAINLALHFQEVSGMEPIWDSKVNPPLSGTFALVFAFFETQYKKGVWNIAWEKTDLVTKYSGMVLTWESVLLWLGNLTVYTIADAAFIGENLGYVTMLGCAQDAPFFSDGWRNVYLAQQMSETLASAPAPVLYKFAEIGFIGGSQVTGKRKAAEDLSPSKVQHTSGGNQGAFGGKAAMVSAHALLEAAGIHGPPTSLVHAVANAVSAVTDGALATGASAAGNYQTVLDRLLPSRTALATGVVLGPAAQHVRGTFMSTRPPEGAMETAIGSSARELAHAIVYAAHVTSTETPHAVGTAGFTTCADFLRANAPHMEDVREDIPSDQEFGRKMRDLAKHLIYARICLDKQRQPPQPEFRGQSFSPQVMQRVPSYAVLQDQRAGATAEAMTDSFSALNLTRQASVGGGGRRKSKKGSKRRAKARRKVRNVDPVMGSLVPSLVHRMRRYGLLVSERKMAQHVRLCAFGTSGAPLPAQGGYAPVIVLPTHGRPRRFDENWTGDQTYSQTVAVKESEELMNADTSSSTSCSVTGSHDGGGEFCGVEFTSTSNSSSSDDSKGDAAGRSQTHRSARQAEAHRFESLISQVIDHGELEAHNWEPASRIAPAFRFSPASGTKENMIASIIGAKYANRNLVCDRMHATGSDEQGVPRLIRTVVMSSLPDVVFEHMCHGTGGGGGGGGGREAVARDVYKSTALSVLIEEMVTCDALIDVDMGTQWRSERCVITGRVGASVCITISTGRAKLRDAAGAGKTQVATGRDIEVKVDSHKVFVHVSICAFILSLYGLRLYLVAHCYHAKKIGRVSRRRLKREINIYMSIANSALGRICS